MKKAQGERGLSVEREGVRAVRAGLRHHFLPALPERPKVPRGRGPAVGLGGLLDGVHRSRG